LKLGRVVFESTAARRKGSGREGKQAREGKRREGGGLGKRLEDESIEAYLGRHQIYCFRHHPCTLKTTFKAPPPLRHCPSTSCSFFPFNASFASSEHFDDSPCSPYSPPSPPLSTLAIVLALAQNLHLHRRQYHLILCLFSSSPATSCSITNEGGEKCQQRHFCYLGGVDGGQGGGGQPEVA